MKSSLKWQSLFLILLMLIFSACSKNKTKLVATLNNPNFDGQPMRQVLVIGVMNNGLNRHVYEDTFVEQLQARGVKATASHTIIPRLDDIADKAAFLAAIKSSGAEHVLLAVLMDQKQYIPEKNTPHNNLGNHFQYSYTNLRRPLHENKSLTVQLETSIYLAATQERLWAGSTKSYDPDSVQIILNGNTRIIMEALKQYGLLP
jgi:hypothetical protein